MTPTEYNDRVAELSFYGFAGALFQKVREMGQLIYVALRSRFDPVSK